jgi:hypothetical protein
MQGLYTSRGQSGFRFPALFSRPPRTVSTPAPPPVQHLSAASIGADGLLTLTTDLTPLPVIVTILSYSPCSGWTVLSGPTQVVYTAPFDSGAPSNTTVKASVQQPGFDPVVSAQITLWPDPGAVPVCLGSLSLSLVPSENGLFPANTQLAYRCILYRVVRGVYTYSPSSALLTTTTSEQVNAFVAVDNILGADGMLVLRSSDGGVNFTHYAVASSVGIPAVLNDDDDSMFQAVDPENGPFYPPTPTL